MRGLQHALLRRTHRVRLVRDELLVSSANRHHVACDAVTPQPWAVAGKLGQCF